MKTLPNPNDERFPLQAEGEYEGRSAADINAAYLAACADPEYLFSCIQPTYPRGIMPLATQAFCAAQYAQRNQLPDPKWIPWPGPTGRRQ